ncbi:unnamed protein product [Gadus morhua 'NCC']
MRQQGGPEAGNQQVTPRAVAELCWRTGLVNAVPSAALIVIRGRRRLSRGHLEDNHVSVFGRQCYYVYQTRSPGLIS